MSDEPLLRIAELSEQLNARVHMHVCETADEDATSVSTYGLTSLRRLDGLGPTRSPVAAHMVHLSDDDIAATAAAGANVVHCPESNLVGERILPRR